MFLEDCKNSFYTAIEYLLNSAQQNGKMESLLGEEYRAFLEALQKELEVVKRPFQLIVTGEYSTGKSTFINSLLGEDLFPVDLTPTDAVISRLCFWDKTLPLAEVHFKDGMKLECDSYSQAWQYVDGTDKEREDFEKVQLVIIRHENPFLQDLEIVNTPGINSIFSQDTQVAKEYLPKADAILWILSAQNLVGKCSAQFQREIVRYKVRVLGIFNMIDTFCEHDSDSDIYGPIDENRLQKALEYVKTKLPRRIEIVPYAAKPILEIRKTMETMEDIPSEFQQQLEKWHYNELFKRLEESFFDEQSEARREKFLNICSRLESAYKRLKDACQNHCSSLQQESEKIQTELNFQKFQEEIAKKSASTEDSLDQEIQKTAQKLLEILEVDQERFLDEGITEKFDQKEARRIFEQNYLSKEKLEAASRELDNKVKKILKNFGQQIQQSIEKNQDLFDARSTVKILNRVNEERWFEQWFIQPGKGVVLGTATVLTTTKFAGILGTILTGASTIATLGIGAIVGALATGIIYHFNKKHRHEQIEKAKQKAIRELRQQRVTIEQRLRDQYYPLIEKMVDTFMEELEKKQTEQKHQLRELSEESKKVQYIERDYRKVLESLRAQIGDSSY